ncbi:MAG: isoprenoid biosynthesis glyoxalase ElbB [Phycisphaerales bacterium]
MTKAAVVLSGCGVFDGSEIHEAVSLLTALSDAGVAVQCFAPDVELAEIDHLAGKPTGQKRRVLTESARIARGEVKALTECKASAFDAVFFPGGFGAAKNLCDFATKGADCTVQPEVARVIREFHSAEKPIGMCCIAPVLAAKVLGRAGGGPGCRLTLGAPSEASKAAEKLGATHEAAPVTAAVVDAKNRLVTAPAYMYGDAPIHEVARGIGEMVRATLELAGAPATA